MTLTAGFGLRGLGLGFNSVDDINPALPQGSYGNYGIFLILGNAGFRLSAVRVWELSSSKAFRARDPLLLKGYVEGTASSSYEIVA